MLFTLFDNDSTVSQMTTLCRHRQEELDDGAAQGGLGILNLMHIMRKSLCTDPRDRF